VPSAGFEVEQWFKGRMPPRRAADAADIAALDRKPMVGRQIVTMSTLGVTWG